MPIHSYHPGFHYLLLPIRPRTCAKVDEIQHCSEDNRSDKLVSHEKIKVRNYGFCFCVINNFAHPLALPLGSKGFKWLGCFDTFCARAQKVQNKGWRSTLCNFGIRGILN